MSMLDAMAARLAVPPHWVMFRAPGGSMTPLIQPGEEVTVFRVDKPEALEVGDIVLARVGGSTYLHKVTAMDVPRGRVQIGNNHGHVNGWTSFDKVYGLYRPGGLEAWM
jgi:signal peptidase I